jgi:TonB family protein
MIAHWMLYGSIVAAMLGLAAFLVEGLLTRWELEARWAWLGAVVLLFILPWTAPLVALWGASGEAGSVLLGSIRIVQGSGPGLAEGSAGAGGIANDFLLTVWLLGSLGMAGYLIRSQLVLRKLRAGWRRGDVRGRVVRLSDSWGPAVVGFFDSEIVLPEWVMELPEEEQELLLEHEAEHLRGRDPWLLLVGLGALVVLPWNLFLWWEIKRLRAAIEIDCDRRVLRRVGRVRAYGQLLVRVAGRDRVLPAAVAAFANRPVELERRLRTMTRIPEGRPWARGILVCATALLLLLGACTVEQPTGLMPSVDSGRPGTMSLAELRPAPAFTPYTKRPELVDRRAYGTALQESYPAELRSQGIGGTTILWVLLDADGAVENVLIQGSSGYDSLDEAAVAAMREATFSPAMFEETPVPVWIQIPVTFATAPSSPA